MEVCHGQRVDLTDLPDAYIGPYMYEAMLYPITYMGVPYELHAYVANAI